eukprot:TRINITY_DN5833_c0_g2_i1.p1 TRINITY_DN5833_c0_g2~~TRINITY_DN5833_c0_g2_i1.p1  ORF type:complete len:298 (+),score=138.34 TRINITY_DN5833_c0_g2_i1:73-966(+)
MALQRNSLPVKYQHWARQLKNGESCIIGDETSDVFSNASLAGDKPARIFLAGNLLVALHPQHSPNAFFKPKVPHDSPVKISVEGGPVDLMGYSMSAIITYDESDDECAVQADAAVPTDAQKVEAKEEKKEKKVEKKEAKKAEEKEAKPAKKAPKKQAATNGASDAFAPAKHVPQDNSQFALHRVEPAAEPEEVDEEEVGVEVIVLKGQEYFHDVRSHKVYQGDPNDAEFKGYFNPHTKCVQATAPVLREANPHQVRSKAKQQAKRAREEQRKQWEAEHGDDSDVTMESEEPGAKKRK